MVDGGKGEGGGEQASPPSTAARHGTTLRPRASVESVFSGGYSPGPMALLSNFYGDGDECKSFSELLAGAMVDPTAPSPMPTTTFALPPGFIDSPSQVITHNLICYILYQQQHITKRFFLLCMFLS